MQLSSLFSDREPIALRRLVFFAGQFGGRGVGPVKMTKEWTKYQKCLGLQFSRALVFGGVLAVVLR